MSSAMRIALAGLGGETARVELGWNTAGRRPVRCRSVVGGAHEVEYIEEQEPSFAEGGETMLQTIPSPAVALAGGFLPMMPLEVTVEAGLARWLEESQLILEEKLVCGGLLEHCLKEGITGLQEGLVVEFGVFTANSLRMIASSLPDRKVFGFDSFVGFQEDWELHSGNVDKEFFSLNGASWDDLNSNIELVKGYFNESLPGFLKEHPEPFGLVHIDCDMYSSTKDIFDIAGSRFQSGTVIVFDEFFCHGADYKGEFTAFYEWAKREGRDFEYIGAGDGSHDLMTRIPKLGEPLYLNRLGAALMYKGLKAVRQNSNFATAVAVKIL